MNALRIATLTALMLITTNALAIEQEAGARLFMGAPTGDFGDVTIVNDVPVFDASKSATDMTTYELGVVLTF